jgi:hypothetical protein
VKAAEALLACALVMSPGCAVERRTANGDGASGESATVSDSAQKAGIPAISTGSLHPPQVALVDRSREGDPGDIAVTRYRVQVKTDTRIDTIPGVRTMTLPGVGADGDVYLFAYDNSGFLTHAYGYDPNTRQLTEMQIPPEINDFAAHLTFSPDARHIAYIGLDSATSYPRGRVLSWPAGTLVAQTLPESPNGPRYESEIDNNDLQWLDADSVELVYHSGRANERTPTGIQELWIHAIVSVKTREVKVDTLASKPEWTH